MKRTVVILIAALMVGTAQSESQRPPVRFSYSNAPLPLIYFGLGISLLQIVINGVAQALQDAQTGPQQAAMVPVPGYCYGSDHPLSATASSREACALFDLKPE